MFTCLDSLDMIPLVIFALFSHLVTKKRAEQQIQNKRHKSEQIVFFPEKRLNAGFSFSCLLRGVRGDRTRAYKGAGRSRSTNIVVSAPVGPQTL